MDHPARTPRPIKPSSPVEISDQSSRVACLREGCTRDDHDGCSRDDDLPASVPLTSAWIRPPPPLTPKPRLQDFVYRSEHFPAVPPEITATSSALDITIGLIAHMLSSRENDLALSFMLRHQVPARHPASWPPASCRERSPLIVTGCPPLVLAAPGLQRRGE